MLAAIGIALMAMACSTSPQANRVLAQGEDSGSVCSLNEAVTTASATYSPNVDLSASIALPGETGVDVVMTAAGAIAAVNTADGGTLYWVNPATGDISKTVELPGEVSDIAFDGGSVVAIASQNTLTRMDAVSGETLSTLPLTDVKRVAIAPDGHIAALANKTVYVYDPNNAEVFSRERNYTQVTDVEVMSCDGQQAVFVTSFRNDRFTVDGRTNPVQIARLESLDFTGKVQWSLFGDSSETIIQNVADTRLYRATMGRDGYLYIAGESAGTATIFRWRGEPMTAEEQRGRTDPFLSRIDQYSSLHNSGAAHLPYYARVHPTEGRLVNAQMSFPRKTSDNKANAMRLGDIATGADGTLYFGGGASAFIANRDNLTLNGVSVGEYVGGDRAWMAIAPDFQSRKFWTVLAKESGKGKVIGVDVGYGYSAALSNVKSGTVPVTTGATEGKIFLSFTTE
ncbi:MAG: WD40 repeat domain-containing protein [Cyanobacteria bacterium J06588_5]